MSLSKTLILVAVIILLIYVLNEVPGWLNMPLPGS